MHRIRSCGRRARAGLAVLLAMWAALLGSGQASREVEALQFPIPSLDELSLSADVVFVGTLTGWTADGEMTRRYTFRVDIPLKGGLDRKSEMAVPIPQDGEGAFSPRDRPISCCSGRWRTAATRSPAAIRATSG